MKKLLLASLCFLMLCASQVFAQSRTVTGTVTAKDDGLPLPGVTVKVAGTTTGTQTSPSGKFTLSVPASAKSLTFSFVGFGNEIVAIPASGVVNAVLSSDTRNLSEVVVTAGGLTATKGSQGYATTAIKPEVLTAGKATNVGAALSGKVAGLQVNAVSSGVNPTVRLVLRGNRSLLGNNQALLVMDNVIVPSSLLGNINPEDIEDIQVLNGAGGAALYGSDASNGVVIITTKKGKKGAAVVKASETVSGEHVSFYPQLQAGFGSGSATDVQEYTPYENQQYGPAFDGVVRQIGLPLSDGRTQSVPYSFNNSKNGFWETGVTKQTDFSVNSGDEKSSTYVAGQYVDVAGTTPGDKYNRFSLRANGNRTLANKVSIGFTTNYVQNHYDRTTQTASIYDQLQQTPGQIVVTDYKDYLNNPFADVNGYYNDYYPNPYFTAANNRELIRNDYLIGTTELKYDPFSFLNFTFRVGVTAANATGKTTVGKYVTTAYTKALQDAGAVKRNDGVGSVSDDDSFSNQTTAELYGTYKKQINDFNVNFTAGASLRQNKSQSQNVAANGLLQAGLYNVDQRTSANATGGETQATTRQQAVYGVFNIGYKGYLNLHVTGRNDWLSVLAEKNRSFFYPAADVSFIPTEAIDFLKNNKVLSSLKLRAGISKVGQANIGAYALLPTFSQQAGYPYSSGPGTGQDNRIVSLDLRPEITKGFEFGADADLYNGRITGSVTFYKTQTTNQTVPVQISNATGFSSYLTNTGQVDNSGIESQISVVPIKTSTGWQLTLSANFTYSDNKVIALANGLPQLNLSTGSTAQTYAIPGLPYPVLQGIDYKRDDQGRIIVDALTGAPTPASAVSLIGKTNPTQRLGTSFELRYKSLRLSALAEYRGGFVIFNSGASGSLDFSGSGARTAYYNRERFVVPNSVYAVGTTWVPNTNVTVIDGGSNFWTQTVNTGVSTNYVINGASWKLREASLSWDVPKSLITRQKVIKGATLSVQGRNLFLWTPKSNIYTDPEYNFTDGNAIGINSFGQTPPTRYYGATLSLTF